MASLESHVLGTDLGAEPYHFLNIEFYTLKILLQLMAQLAEVVPQVGHLEQQLGGLAAWSIFIGHILARCYQRAGLLLLFCQSGSFRTLNQRLNFGLGDSKNEVSQLFPQL